MAQSLEKKNNQSYSQDDIQAAVQDAVSKAIAEAMYEIGLKSASNTGDKTTDVLQILTHQLTKMEHSQSGRQYVDPILLQKREDSYIRMEELISKARKNKTPPMYRVVGDMFFGDAYIRANTLGDDGKPKETFIRWSQAPNNCMLPADEVAREIFDAFKDAVGITHDPVQEEGIWTDSEGRVHYGKNVARNTSREAPRAHPDLEIIQRDAPRYSTSGEIFPDKFIRDPHLTAFPL